MGKAFQGLLDVNLECYRITSSLVEDVHKAAQAALDRRPRAKTEPAVKVDATCRRVSAPSVQSLPADDNINRRASAPTVCFDDLLGDVSGLDAKKKPPPK